MDKFVGVLWLFCLISISKCQYDTLDCDQAPPANVDPSICCRISKPFDRLNFPDCFADVDEASTARNEILNRNDADDRNPRGSDDDFTRTRVNGDERNRKSNDDRRSERIPTENGNRGSDSGEDDRRDSRPNGKPHWGFKDGHHHGGGWHYYGHGGHAAHGDYHSFGSGGRYRHKRQVDRVVVRTSVRAQVTLGSGVGNGNCAMQCIFNQTRVVRNNELNRDAALILYGKYFPEVPEDLLTQVIDKCIDDVKSLPSNRNNRTRNTRNRCWNAPGVFAACFNQEIYTQCPDNIKNTSDDCDALRDFIDKCSPSN